MKYQISGQELEKALELVSKVMNPLKKAESVLDRPSDEDLLFYDNVSMMDKVKVSERTLQRRRKNGEIRFIRFGGKIYYPKNFMVLPAQEPEVPDDEKDSLDADVILKSYQDGTEEANKEKVRRGWNNLLTVDGWTLRPTYNTTTNNLEWAINVRGSEGAAVNYETRLLGRRGVMSVTLVCDPDALNQILPSYRSLIGGFQYKAGGKYADFRSGDKIAQYGLSALIVGGAAAAASKSGLAKALGKGVFAFFAAIAVAIGGFLKKIWAYVTHGSSGN